MNKELIQARKNLLAGREPEINLPLYLQGLAGYYYRMANYNLAMQYTTFAEGISEKELELTGKEEEAFLQIKKAIADYCGGEMNPPEQEKVLTGLWKLRDAFVLKMQNLTAFTDGFYLHEYAMKRIAPAKEETVAPVNTTEATNEILAFLFAPEQKDALRENISVALSELPIRMTKQKFLEWVRNTSAAFKESDPESIYRAFYMLRSAAGLISPTQEEDEEELNETLEFFGKLHYSGMDDKTYAEAKQRLERTTQKLVATGDLYCQMTEVLNSLLILYFTEAFVSAEDIRSVECCRQALRLAIADGETDDEAYAQAFGAFEGIPEQLEEALLTEEAAWEQLSIDESLVDAIMQRVLYTRISYAKKLHSTSLFAELDGTEKQGDYEKELDAFCTDFEQITEQSDRAVNRARMAQVLYHLPVPFTKSTEVRDYIFAAFDNCHDDAEKTAVLRALRAYAEDR